MSDITENPKYKVVMIVDDNPFDLHIANHVIKKSRFAENVISMGSAKKALEYLLSLIDTPDELPQYIFLDIRMPEMDGFGFLDEYKKLPAVVQKNCIIMMLSTSLDTEDHKRASENKFVNQFLSKPLNKEMLGNI